MQQYKGYTYTPVPKTAWDNLSLAAKAEMMKVAVRHGITALQDIKDKYNEFAEGGDTNPGMTGMMKSKLATAAHFGNPTARRMANYDTRSYTWPGEYEYDNGIGEPKRGNVFVGSYGNLVIPQIQDTGKELTFIEDVWSPENDRRSFMQSLKFNNEEDARYFGEHYKEIAPMMNLYRDGGHKIHIKPENRGKFTALKERTGHSATWFKEHGTPAQKKMAIFALNSRHWKHGLGGNLYGDGGDFWDTLKTGIQKARNKVKEWGLDKSPGQHFLEWLAEDKNTSQVTDSQQAKLLYRNRPAEKRGIVDISGKRTIQVVPKRERENNSPTKSQSTKLENSMRTLVMRQQNVAGGSNPNFDIPYIPEKAIIINGSTTSTNVLDSIAKYAGIHNRNPYLSQHPIHEKDYYTKRGLPRTINMNEMLGLSTRETKNGAQPYFNQDGTPEYNREVGNSNYFTAFGYIPADNLMRNFQYNDAIVDRTIPPILDAFQYYAQGDYNAKRDRHIKAVNAEGEKAWKNPKVKEWWELSGKYWYNNPNGSK